MTWCCAVCGFVVAPDEDGRILTVGLQEPAPGSAWAWGPKVVHPECRRLLRPPEIGRDVAGLRVVEERVRA